MKSFNGIELEVGQKVVVAMAHGRNSGASLMAGKVVKINPKTVRVLGRSGEYTKDPSKVVVLPA